MRHRFVTGAVLAAAVAACWPSGAAAQEMFQPSPVSGPPVIPIPTGQAGQPGFYFGAEFVMLKQTREQDLGLFLKLSNSPKPETVNDVPTYVLVPAFTISELKTAFQMGFVMFVPFLIIDLIVSSALLSMGMMMLPPVIVSLPFKILLFVLVDGWYLIIGSLVGSFAT